ncbi:hypothetical protein BDFB_011037 [Asbolus verrucosus]|uniref:Uncharacterized protein n=1 Tax=Asbolus verrucosus TaxID=1661398 RepID=A0A482VAH4_ASBVE|nr:hypothetical protein BDFB_011037 [Asbolus verrucosus]
MRTLQEII